MRLTDFFPVAKKSFESQKGMRVAMALHQSSKKQLLLPIPVCKLWWSGPVDPLQPSRMSPNKCEIVVVCPLGKKHQRYRVCPHRTSMFLEPHFILIRVGNKNANMVRKQDLLGNFPLGQN